MTNNKYSASLSCRQIARLLKKIGLHDGDVILVKKSKFKTEEVLQALREGVERLGLEKVYVAMLEDFDDIQSLNRQEMNAHGWYHIDQVNKVIKRNG